MDEKLKAKVAERKEFNIQKRKRGRPKQSEVKAKKVGNRNAIGRPKGDAAIINDYKSRMLASPKSKLVLQSICYRGRARWLIGSRIFLRRNPRKDLEIRKADS